MLEYAMIGRRVLSIPDDGDAVAAAGIRDGYTLGFADVAGFRMGTCQPFPVFDPIEFRHIEATEHPLAVMDCTLVWKRYMGLSQVDAIRYCVALAEEVRNHGGELVVLWHSTKIVDE